MLERNRAGLEVAEIAVNYLFVKSSNQDEKVVTFVDEAALPASADLTVVFSGVYSDDPVGHQFNILLCVLCGFAGKKKIVSRKDAKGAKKNLILIF
jgi:hypothetical protein